MVSLEVDCPYSLVEELHIVEWWEKRQKHDVTYLKQSSYITQQVVDAVLCLIVNLDVLTHEEELAPVNLHMLLVELLATVSADI